MRKFNSVHMLADSNDSRGGVKSISRKPRGARRHVATRGICGVKEDFGVISDFEMDWRYRYFFEKRGMKAPPVETAGVLIPCRVDIEHMVDLAPRGRKKPGFDYIHQER